MTPSTVTKASGDKEPFDENKLRRSLKSAGADEQIIDQIAAAINDMLYDGISTQKIYNEAFRKLRQYSNRSAGRYKLKEAILRTRDLRDIPLKNSLANC
ncbi:MAG: ATP cone domain-containing protein [Balneolaceae bacterium]|nr:ATP cone domain-containing protein [Balneolaceae bacterium]